MWVMKTLCIPPFSYSVKYGIFNAEADNLLKKELCKRYGGQHADNNTDKQRYGKVLNSTCTEDIKYNCRNNRCYVGVDNGGYGSVKACVHGCTNALSCTELVLDSLKYNYVCVNSHTD